MKRPALCVLLALLGACSDDDEDPKPLPDAGETCKSPGLAALVASEKRWKALAADGGNDYWYEHENCLINAPQGQVFVVQVEAGKPRDESSRDIERSECEITLNALGSVEASTFEQLYAMCHDLFDKACDTEFVADDRGVLRTCRWEDTKHCFDNCGEGVHIRHWDFGQAP
jgi:hypothetical protein